LQANEYECLMILMGECRTRLGNYEGGVDDEIRLLKNKVEIPSQLIWLTIIHITSKYLASFFQSIFLFDPESTGQFSCA